MLKRKNLGLELRHSRGALERYLSDLDRQVQAYVGSMRRRRSSGKLPTPDPENIYYEMASLILPVTAYQRPVANCSSRLGRRAALETAMFRAGMNRVVTDGKVEDSTERQALDSLFSFGVNVTTFEPRTGYVPGEADPAGGAPDTPWWPRWYRWSPWNFAIDALAEHPTEARWTAHRVTRDYDDIEREAKENPKAGWRLDVLKKMRGRSRQSLAGNDSSQELDRNSVSWWEMHVRDHELDVKKYRPPFYNGTMFYLADDGAGEQTEEVRDAQPFFGPFDGPHDVWGILVAPDEVWPLAPFMAAEGIIRNLNAHARALDRRLARQKVIGLVSKTDPELAAVVKRGEDGGIYGVDTDFLEQKVREVKLGAGPEGTAIAIDIAQRRLERLFGFQATRRGQPDPSVSATADAIANAASERREAYIVGKCHRATSRQLARLGWYLFYSRRVWFFLGEEGARQLEQAGMEFRGTPTFQGGVQQGQVMRSYEDLEITAELNSQRMVTDRERRATGKERLELLAVISSLPTFVDKEQVAREMAELYGWDELPLLFDREMELAIANAALGGGEGGQGGSSGGAGQPVRPDFRVVAPVGPSRIGAGGGAGGKQGVGMNGRVGRGPAGLSGRVGVA